LKSFSGRIIEKVPSRFEIVPAFEFTTPILA